MHCRALRLEYATVAWNVVEALVAIAAGLIAGSVALVGFGLDSGIEVVSAVALLWRLRAAGADAGAPAQERAERRALRVVAATFFLLAAYVGVEAVGALAGGDDPDPSTVGVALSVASLAVMPWLAHRKRQIGREMGSHALQADAAETWVCACLALALLLGVGLNAAFGWAWADSVGALLMLPVILWQGREALADSRR